MTDFVLQQKENVEFHMNDTIVETGKLTQQIFKYAKFLKQPLTLGMFVPCDEEEKMIEKQPYFTFADPEYKEKPECIKYWKAKERVLFEGFEIKDIGLGSFAIRKNGWIIMRCSKAIGAKWENIFPDIESLTVFEIELTPSALKQIGL